MEVPHKSFVAFPVSMVGLKHIEARRIAKVFNFSMAYSACTGPRASSECWSINTVLRKPFGGLHPRFYGPTILHWQSARIESLRFLGAGQTVLPLKSLMCDGTRLFYGLSYSLVQACG